jgi:ribosomal protein L15
VLQSKTAPVKLLGNGNLSKKLQITLDAASESARRKVQSVGGTLTLPAEGEAAPKNSTAEAH